MFASGESWLTDLARYLLASSLRGGLLLLAVGGLTLLCARRSASLRHLLWALGLAQVGLLTALGWALPGWHLHGLPADLLPEVLGARLAEGALSPAAASLAGGAAAPVGEAVLRAGAPGAAVAAGSSGGGSPWPALLLALWAGGALVLLGRCLLSLRAARALVRLAQPVGDAKLRALADRVAARLSLRQPVDLRFCPGLGSPFATGVLRPVLLLPPAALDWAPEQMESVLLHEMAHVRRGDCAVQLLAQLVRAVHWVNPLCWLAARRLIVERERACDDHVLEAGTRPSSYAAHLLGVAGHQLPPARAIPALAGAAMVGCSQLSHRLVRLLDGRRNHALLRRRTRLLLSLGALAVALPVACVVGERPSREGSLRLTYQVGPDPSGKGEVERILTRRLDALDLDSAQVRRQGERLVVELRALPEGQRAAVKQALARKGSLDLVVVDSEDRPDSYLARLSRAVDQDAGARAAGISSGADVWKVVAGGQQHNARYLEGPRAAIERYLGGLPAALRPEAGHRFLLDPVQPGSDRVRTVYVDDGRSVSLTRIADATASAREGVPDGFEVMVAVDPADGDRLEALTRHHIGHRVAVVLDGSELWGAPVVQVPLRERFAITAQGTMEQANRLAASFKAGALPSALQLVAEEPLR